jgi:hypothetical protein
MPNKIIRNILAAMALFNLVSSVLFMFAGTASAQAVTRAYGTDQQLQRGMIVRLTEKNTKKVEALKAEQMAKMEGVVVAANDSPVTLSSSDQTAQQVFVATTGRYNVLVSNQNGPIKKDDYITISAVAGIGMKADGKQSRIVGKALTGFDGTTNVSGKTTVKNSSGSQIPITLSLIGVEISVGHNPIESKKTSLIPGLEFLQKAAGGVVDHDVAPSQLYLALTALIVSAFIAGSILYGGVRTSMTAIGRNPLAKTSVMRNLVQVIVTSIIILIIGVVAVYLILKL